MACFAAQDDNNQLDVRGERYHSEHGHRTSCTINKHQPDVLRIDVSFDPNVARHVLGLNKPPYIKLIYPLFVAKKRIPKPLFVSKPSFGTLCRCVSISSLLPREVGNVIMLSGGSVFRRRWPCRRRKLLCSHSFPSNWTSKSAVNPDDVSPPRI